VRGEIVGADVRLELDDPARSPACLVIADQARAEQRTCGLDGRALEEGARDDAQR
jgi:hypothetical protein